MSGVVRDGTVPIRPPVNANLYALLHDHFADRMGEPCLLIPDGPVIHYDELDATSARIAHALCAEGCVPEDRVAAQVDKCWEALALYLGCLRRPRVSAAQHRLPERRARLFLRRRGAACHRLPS
jgi:acyl-CoA synthetase (AMP-forming)/AMP-acid ligase II